MALKPYPIISPSADLEEVTTAVRAMVRERATDVAEFDNLQNRFLPGRLVSRVPTGATQVLAGDRVGDTAFDTNYSYTLINISGTLTWRRAAHSAW